MARDNWHFDGYITSDCDADAGVQGHLDQHGHHYAATAEEAVRDVLRAGVDVDCGTFVQQHADSALNQSLFDMSLVDTRLANLLKVRFRLGHFDPKGPLDAIPRSTVCSDYAIALSLDGAEAYRYLASCTKVLGSLPNPDPNRAASIAQGAALGALA